MAQWLRNPASQQTDPGYAMGALLGAAIAGNQRKVDLKRTMADADAYKANATNGSITDADRAAAGNQLLDGTGISLDMVGQKADDVLIKNSQTWEGLEQQKAGMDEAGQKAITAQQQKLAAQSDYLRKMFPTVQKNYGANTSSADKLAQQKLLQQQQGMIPQQQAIPAQQQGIANNALPTDFATQTPNGNDLTAGKIAALQGQQQPVQQQLAAQQVSNPDLTLSRDRLIQQAGGQSTVDSRAAELAKARAAANFNKDEYTAGMKAELARKGHWTENIDTVMPGAEAFANNTYQQTTIAPLQLAMQKAIQSGDMQTATAIAARLDQMSGGKLAAQLINAGMPNYQLHDTQLGNSVNTTMYNPKTGQGKTVNVAVGVKPDTVANNNTSLATTGMNNNTQLQIADKQNAGANWRAMLSSDTTKEVAKMKDGTLEGGKLSVAAAENIMTAYNKVESTRLPGDKTPNPFAGLMPLALQTHNSAMGGNKQSAGFDIGSWINQVRQAGATPEAIKAKLREQGYGDTYDSWIW